MCLKAGTSIYLFIFCLGGGGGGSLILIALSYLFYFYLLWFNYMKKSNMMTTFFFHQRAVKIWPTAQGTSFRLIIRDITPTTPNVSGTSLHLSITWFGWSFGFSVWKKTPSVQKTSLRFTTEMMNYRQLSARIVATVILRLWSPRSTSWWSPSAPTAGA